MQAWASSRALPRLLRQASSWAWVSFLPVPVLGQLRLPFPAAGDGLAQSGDVRPLGSQIRGAGGVAVAQLQIAAVHALGGLRQGVELLLNGSQPQLMIPGLAVDVVEPGPQGLDLLLHAAPAALLVGELLAKTVQVVQGVALLPRQHVPAAAEALELGLRLGDLLPAAFHPRVPVPELGGKALRLPVQGL